MHQRRPVAHGEQAFDDLLRSAHPRRAGEDGGDRSHSFLIGFLPFGEPCSGLCAARLDHGNALGVNGGHQDCTGGGSHGALMVEGVEIPGCIRQDLFQAAFGDGNTGQLGDVLDRFQKRILHGGFDQTALEFVGEGSRRQCQRPVEREDAGRARAGVAHTDQFHGSKDGGQGSVAETAVRIKHLTLWQFQLQSRSHISIAAMLQMSLEEKALDLAAFGLLLGLDLVERELESAGGCQP